MTRALVCSMALLVCFCSSAPAKLDTTSDETVKTSLEKMREQLDDQGREDLSQALAFFMFQGNSLFLDSLTDNSKTASLKILDGMTAQEIIDRHKADSERKAKELEEANKKFQLELEQKQKRRDLLSEVSDLFYDDKVEEALSKINELAALSDFENDVIKEWREKIENQIQEIQAREDYLKKVEITEFKTKRIDTYTEKQKPAYRVAVKNNGDRSLKEVEVTVYFLDKYGKRIFEDSYTIVLVSKFAMYGRNNDPLKPGYVREMKKGNWITLDNSLDDWAEAKAEVEVTDIEFE